MKFTKIKERIRAFDVFALGNSAILYYLLIFYLLPFLVLLGVSDKFTLPSYSHAVNGRALLYITFGIFALALGCFSSVPRRIAKSLPNIFRGVWNFKRAEIVFWVTLLVGIAAKTIRILGGGYLHLNILPSFSASSFYSTVGFLDWFGYIAIALAFAGYYFLKKQGNPLSLKWGMFAWGAFVIEILYALPSCGRENVIVPVVLYLIVRSYFVKLEYWRVILITAVVAFMLFPFGNACRHLQELYANQAVQGRTVDITAVPDPLSSRPDLISSSFLSRIDQSRVFSKILETNEPFFYGRSLLEFFVSLGPPRFIWKNKPVSINASGNEFGRRIGVLGPEDFKTSVGPTVVGDWYMNFGVSGIIIGMFLMGVLWRFIYEYLIKRTNISLSGVLVYSIFWVQIIKGMEGWIAPVYAGIVKLLVLLIVIHIFLVGGRAERS